MFGCKQFSETEILLYIEDSAPEELNLAIEKHLRECRECLNEVMELSRIQSRMENENPEPQTIPALLHLRLKNHTLNLIQALGMESFQPDFQAVRNSPQNIAYRLKYPEAEILPYNWESDKLKLEIRVKEPLSYKITRQKNKKLLERGRLNVGVNYIENLPFEDLSVELGNRSILLKLEES